MKKELIYGLMALTIAGIASAFKGTEKKMTTYFYVQRTSGKYDKTVSSLYDPTYCIQMADPCAYQVTAAGLSHVTALTFTKADALVYINQHYIEPVGTDRGIYLDE